MLPVQDFFNGKLTVIRPFYMIAERVIEKYAWIMEFPRIDLGCPSDGITKREDT